MMAVDLYDYMGATLTARTHRALVRRGHIVAQRPGLNVLRLDPRLTIDKADIEAFLTAFEGILADTALATDLGERL
jgi:4-aminobutyrate aminotransferase-like enzyme